ncbi:hypothetical protein GOP47_0000970 [Adiantum capillus-veneris]|uniref:F-box/kelch-repeat protein n=1 Tax=Adiantum capillus-veneris TaxID=13818 RepID=A0A9D4VFQ9_ADICA|nr:hypothetical protein GOP47_0000970 [Adiantum capillus-veneris]
METVEEAAPSSSSWSSSPSPTLAEMVPAFACIFTSAIQHCNCSSRGSLLCGQQHCAGQEKAKLDVYMQSFHKGSQHWVNVSMGEKIRPRSPVICRGSIYGLRDEGSLWWQSWKLVVSDVNMFVDANEGPSRGLYAGSCNWCVVNQRNGAEFSALIRRPRLLGADGCLLLVGGLKNSVLTYSCSTFVIFKFDFTALEWVEVSRMPQDLYWGFQDLAYVKIFGSVRDVFFFCEMTNAIVACNLSNGVVWQRVVDCPDLLYCLSGLFKGFTFNVKLGSAV